MLSVATVPAGGGGSLIPLCPVVDRSPQSGQVTGGRVGQNVPMSSRSGSSSRVDLTRLCALFLAVAEERHFGAAADRLGTTQPTVSQGLQRLEGHLGVRLLDRTRDGAVVTSAGRHLLPLARTLVRDAAHFEAAAGELASRGLTFAVGASATTPAHLSAAAVTSMRSQVESVTVARGQGPELVARVENGELDVAVLEDPSPAGDLVRGVMHRLPRRLAVPEGMISDPRARIPRQELRHLDLAVTPRATGPAAWDLLIDLLKEAGIDPRPVEAPSSADVLTQVAAGSAFAVVDAFSPTIDGVQLLDLPGRFDHRFRALVHPDRQRTPDGHDIRSLVDRGLARVCRTVTGGPTP